MRKSALFLALLASSLLIGSTAFAGDVRGPRMAANRLFPGDGIDYSLILRGKEPTTIRVLGDGDGDLDCFLADQYGNVGVRDISPADGCLIRMKPNWTGPFTLRVVNNGRLYSDFNLTVTVN